MALRRDTKLQLAPHVQLSLVGGDLLVYAGHAELSYERDKLPVVAAFVAPHTMEEALSELGAGIRTRHEWAELSAFVIELVEAGVLVAEGLPAVGYRTHGFAAASVHIAMLDDAARTQAFVEAIRREVRPGDVVLDIGTGTGVLALAAAQAGAAHVYAIEESTIADTAEAVFRRAGVAERVSVIRGRSTQIELPEPANVLVSEMIGHEPLAEHVLETTADALARHLVSDARLIPMRLRVLASAVTIDDVTLQRQVFDAKHVDVWSERYGVDLSGLLEDNSDTMSQFLVEPGVAAAWAALSPAVVLVEVDLGAPPRELDASVEVRVVQDGVLDGVVVFFELDVDRDHALTNRTTRTDCHWKCPVWLLAERTAARAGDVLTLRYRRVLGCTKLEVVRRTTP